MFIFTNHIISNAYMSMYKARTPIRESRSYIYESAIDTRINNLAKSIAKDIFKTKYNQFITDTEGNPQKYASENEMKYDRVFIKHLVGEKIPFSKDQKSNAKFFLGALRIFGDILKNTKNEEDINRKCLSLNKILGVIVHDSNHINEYDNNLNGKTLEELENIFGKKVKEISDKEKEEINSKTYVRDERYEIVHCNTWKDMLQFGKPLTTWCVAQKNGGKHAYDSYTDSGLCKFYVCLRHGYEELKAVPGENPPLDDYGLSMIAVCVDPEGNLKTCTCRWNHANGGNDNIMDAKQISDLLGVNFFETFKPRDPKKAFSKLKYDKSNPLCTKLGLRSDGYYNYYCLKDDKIIKYDICYQNSAIACLANKQFEWYDLKSGEKIAPPNYIYGDFKFYGCDNLTSLEGSPNKVIGNFSCSNCNSLTSLKGAPSYVYRDFNCHGCSNLTSLEGAPNSVNGFFDCSNCDNLTSLEGAPKKVGRYFYCVDCTSLTSLKGAPSEVGEGFYCSKCYNLTSLEGAPNKVEGHFDCSRCCSLTSLKGSPSHIGGDFHCDMCDKLTSLEGSPKKVYVNFVCSRCENLTSLKGAPSDVGGAVYCYDCPKLTSIDDAPESIRDKILW